MLIVGGVMIKSILFSAASLWAFMSFAAHDELYYSGHPNALQHAIEKCPENAPNLVSCEKLSEIASRLNESAYLLRVDPQGYGKKILELQEQIAEQEAALRTSADQPQVKVVLDENKRILQERLAIVKWLESPES
jgi:hypothetical protein